MADPVTAMAAGGLAMGGAGSLLGALNQPGSPPQINPEIQAELAARGVDINEFLANLQGSGQNFAQEVTKYPIEVQQLLQKAYSQMYGEAEQGAADFAQSAFAGEDPAYLKNQIAAFGADVGGQREGTDAGVNEMIAQMGIDPTSPYAAEMRRKAQEGVSSQFAGGVAKMRNDSALSNLALANSIIGRGMTTNRMAGVKLPEAPLTAEQTAQKKYEADLAAWEKNRDSAFAGGYSGRPGQTFFDIMRSKPKAPSSTVPHPTSNFLRDFFNSEGKDPSRPQPIPQSQSTTSGNFVGYNSKGEKVFS